MNNHLPSSELTIRPATFTDIESIRNVALKTWPVSYAQMLGKEQIDYMLQLFYSPAALEQQIRDQHYFFLALRNYAPVGFASFSRVEGSVYKLQKLYVLPTEQKAGTGKALLETIETVAKSMGGTRLQLNVNRKNIAKSFYDRNGFKVLETVDINIGEGYFMNDYIMEKEL